VHGNQTRLSLKKRLTLRESGHNRTYSQIPLISYVQFSCETLLDTVIMWRHFWPCSVCPCNNKFVHAINELQVHSEWPGLSFYLWLYSPSLDLGRFFSSLILHTVGRTPWTGDQSVTRPQPTHRTTQIQNKRTDRHPCLEWDSKPRSSLEGNITI
jgi:hypothetical protein